MEILVYTLISGIGLATISRVGMVSGINIYNFYKKKKCKIELKKEIKKSIKECNYELFQDCIYKMKAYDNTYNKSLYIKMKQKYRFGSKCHEDIYYFNRRFNITQNFDTEPAIIIQIIRDEIELSLNKQNIYL
jgi:hypothetical protein